MTVLRLLFVEDNDDLREAIGLMLEAEGRHISAFGTAEEALAAFEREPFDVLITEACPLPSLIQRVGRLNRDGDSNLGLGFVVSADKADEVVVRKGTAAVYGIETVISFSALRRTL